MESNRLRNYGLRWNDDRGDEDGVEDRHRPVFGWTNPHNKGNGKDGIESSSFSGGVNGLSNDDMIKASLSYADREEELPCPRLPHSHYYNLKALDEEIRQSRASSNTNIDRDVKLHVTFNGVVPGEGPEGEAICSNKGKGKDGIESSSVSGGVNGLSNDDMIKAFLSYPDREEELPCPRLPHSHYYNLKALDEEIRQSRAATNTTADRDVKSHVSFNGVIPGQEDEATSND